LRLFYKKPVSGPSVPIDSLRAQVPAFKFERVTKVIAVHVCAERETLCRVKLDCACDVRQYCVVLIITALRRSESVLKTLSVFV
jgi:hypothetical protein